MGESKIGRNIKLRQKDVGDYTTIGIAMTLEGFEIRRVRMRGDVAQAYKMLYKCVNKSEALMRFHTETQKLGLEFKMYQIERKKGT